MVKFNAVFLVAVVAVASTSSQTSAFSPVYSAVGGVAHHANRCKFSQNIQPTSLYSTEGDQDRNDEVPTPTTDALSQKPASFTNEPKQPESRDPLVQSLTRNDVDTTNVKKTNLPLLGEVPVDGSLLLLIPVAIIAVVGFILSVQIGFRSKDAIAEQLDQISNVMSQPPVKKTVPTTGCRGLCSDQDAQLDNMKGFMEGLSKKKAAMADES